MADVYTILLSIVLAIAAALAATLAPSTALLDLRNAFLLKLPFQSTATSPNTQPLLDQAIASLKSYDKVSRGANSAKRKSARKNSMYWTLNLDGRYGEMDYNIHANNRICQRMLRIARSVKPVEHSIQKPNYKVEVGRVREVFSHFVRDWSSEGEKERSQIFPPILSLLKERFPDEEARAEERVLVPGAGLARLSYELAALNFAVSSNELSYFMTLGSRLIFSPNSTSIAEQHTVHPFASLGSHHTNKSSLLRGVTFPDILPDPKVVERIKVQDGDFMQAFKGEEGSFSAVVTLFFIDTSPNIIETLSMIHKLLKPGGVWINLGPLLYASYAQVELTAEEVVRTAELTGFKVKQNRFIETEYTQNKEGMFRYIYKSAFFECEKARGIEAP